MISIIIPAYNEEKAIEATIEKAKLVIEINGDENSEVIVVDDCSTDNTYRLAINSGAMVIRNPQNAGYGRSLKEGIRIAKNDLIIITDADGTYPIQDTEILINEMKSGFNMVVGARHGRFYRESITKQLFRFFLKKLVEFTSGTKIDDINSGFRIFSKKEAIGYFDNLCDTFSFTTSITLAYLMTGKFIKYIPISYNQRIGKSKVRLFRDSLRTLQFITEAILYYNPVKLFIAFSFLLVFLAIINFIIALALHLTIGYFLGIGCILLTILIIALGMITIMLKQILTKIQNR